MRRLLKLTKEQRALVKSATGVAERAAHFVLRRFGEIEPLKIMIESAHYGVALAAMQFDGSMGEFLDFALFKAIYTVLDEARANKRQLDVILTARAALFEFLAHEHVVPRDDDIDAPGQRYRQDLDAYKRSVLTSMLENIANMRLAAGGEDEMVEVLDAVRAAEAVKHVHEELAPDKLAVLRATDKELEALARERGTSFWTLQRQRKRLRELVGARLEGKGFDAATPWSDEVWAAMMAQGGEAAVHAGSQR